MSLDQEFWNQRYAEKQTGWDLGAASPPLVRIFEQIENKDADILIPGCGNAYEAQYLLDHGFTSITLIDIAPLIVKDLQHRFQGNANIRIICEDFFDHKGQYDYIIEQTFFCALDPTLRPDYVSKMHSILKPEGILTGVFFSRNFEQDGPPFGGTQIEYEALFGELFRAEFAESDDSIPARLGNEIKGIMRKR